MGSFQRGGVYKNRVSFDFQWVQSVHGIMAELVARLFSIRDNLAGWFVAGADFVGSDLFSSLKQRALGSKKSEAFDYRGATAFRAF